MRPNISLFFQLTVFVTLVACVEYTIILLLLYTYVTLLDTNTSLTSGFGLFVLSIVVSYLHHFGFIKLKTPTRERDIASKFLWPLVYINVLSSYAGKCSSVVNFKFREW